MRKSYFVCVIIGSNRPVRAATVNGSLDFAVISSESSRRLTERIELLYSPDVEARQKLNLGEDGDTRVPAQPVHSRKLKLLSMHTSQAEIAKNMFDAFDFFFLSVKLRD